MQSSLARRGFTFIEIMVFIVVVATIAILGLMWFIKTRVSTVVTGQFVTAPATVSQWPQTGTFVYQLSRKVGANPPVGIPSRGTTIAVFPATGVRIMELNNLVVNAASGGSSTDAAGQVQIIIRIDYAGQARIVATDRDTGRQEQVMFTGVP